MFLRLVPGSVRNRRGELSSKKRVGGSLKWVGLVQVNPEIPTVESLAAATLSLPILLDAFDHLDN